MKACFNNRNLKFILYINANIKLFILSYSINESNCIYSYFLKSLDIFCFSKILI